MSVPAGRRGQPPARRRRLIALGASRSLASTVALVVLYYLLPLDHAKNVPVTLAVGLVILAAVIVLQLRVISRSAYPGLYFTVTVFSTVGFGDITAASQSARLVVTVQMLLDLLALGLVVRAFVSAVQAARQQASPDAPSQGDSKVR